MIGAALCVRLNILVIIGPMLSTEKKPQDLKYIFLCSLIGLIDNLLFYKKKRKSILSPKNVVGQ